MNIKYEIDKRKEKLIMRLVWMLPKSIVKWAAIKVIAHATTGQYSSQVVPELSAMEALGRWGTA